MPRPTTKRSQAGLAGNRGKTRSGIPEKCRKCAMLSADKAQALHGPEGDGCWNPAVCYSRRSYARHRDRINRTRSRKRQATGLEQLSVEFEPATQLVFAVLIVHREAGADTPVHAVGAEIWQGQEKIAVVPSIHCSGMVPSQVHTYLGKMLSLLEQRYSVKKFASQIRLDPGLCGIRPCPLCP